MVAIYHAYYNFCRVDQTLRVTPAMEAGLTDHAWSVEELVGLLEQKVVGFGSMNFRAMQTSKVARMWGLVLAAGLVAGWFGVWEDGWRKGDTIGLIVCCILLLCILAVGRRENRAQ